MPRPPHGRSGGYDEYDDLKELIKKLRERIAYLKERARYYKAWVAKLLKLIKKLQNLPYDYAVFVRPHPDGKPNEADILFQSNLRKVSIEIEGVSAKDLKCGWEVLLGPMGGVIIQVTKDYWTWGAEVIFKKKLSESLVLVADVGGQQGLQQCYLSPELQSVELKEGDRLLNCGGLLVKILPKTGEEERFYDLEEITRYNWSMVGGLTKVIATIKREIDPFKDPKVYKEKFEGTDLNKGMIFWGPPGCGKTLLAKCVAAELARSRGLKCYFISLAGADLSDKYVGETERKIRELFAHAKEKTAEGALVIIFFDEMDSLFRRRDTSMEHEPWIAGQVGTLNKILDGVDPIRNILVLGATNQIELIDQAILRPGRLGVHIEVKRPKIHEEIVQILRIYLTPTLPFAEQYFVEEYSYQDWFGSGELEKVRLDSDPEKIRDHFVDMVVKRLLYIGEPVDVVLKSEGENETLTIDNRLVIETRSGNKEMYLKDNLSGAVLAGVVETAKKIAYARYVHLKEKAIMENSELWALREQMNELVGEDKTEARAQKEKELEEVLRKYGVKPEIKKRDFFKATDEVLEGLKKSDKQAKQRKRKLGFELK